MRIKNEYIKIKTDKEIVLHNYIYDEYLKIFSKSQIEEDEDELYSLNSRKTMYSCFIKFESNFEDITNKTINDFDIRISSVQTEVNGNSQNVNAIYTYSTKNGIYDIRSGKNIDDLNDYAGKKVTALAFGNEEILACIDTSNYSIYIIKDEELSISRKDIISSDAVCDGVDYPIHLAPIFKTTTYESAKGKYQADVYAKLYSIGLGQVIGKMSEEYIIGKDINIKEESNTSFGFNLRKGNEQSIFPRNNLYCGSGKYPLPLYIEKELHPKVNLYSSNRLYPLESNYKYIIYKYEMYYFDRGAAKHSLGYYTMNLYNTTKGIFEILTKIERS